MDLLAKKTDFFCDILDCEIYTPCRLVDCPYYFVNEDNFNCIRFYSKGEPLRVEEIAFVLSIPVSMVKSVKKAALLNLRRMATKLVLIGDHYIDEDSYLSDLATNQDKMSVVEKHFSCNPSDVIRTAYNMSSNVLATSEVIGVSYSKTKRIVSSDSSLVNNNGYASLLDLINKDSVRRIIEQCDWHNHVNAKLFNLELDKIQREYNKKKEGKRHARSRYFNRRKEKDIRS